jgi:hypothetical protein
MKLIKYTNAEYEEEKALYDLDGEYIIKKGDYYHDKIDEWIDGFIQGLDYANEEVDLETKEINKNDAMFFELDFYYEED